MRIEPKLLFALLLCPSTHAGDGFEGGSNSSGWSFNVTVPDIIESTGGNPGGWLHNPSVSSFAPIATHDPNSGSTLSGDYRAMDVTRITVDARTDAASNTSAGREFSIVLRDTKGTPNVNDDDYAYFVGPLIPQTGQGWVSYSFEIPSQSTDAVPAGWSGGWVGDLENFRPGIEWNDVITSVDVVEFWWLNPSFFAIFQTWDVGIDNVCQEIGPDLPPNYCGPAVPNSTGQSATIVATGSPIAADNNLTLTATLLPTNQFGYFVNSQTQGFIQNIPGSQGNLCLAGGIGRILSSIGSSGAAGEISADIDLSQLPTSGGPVTVMAGETWNFQAWFRDVNPDATSNFTDGISLLFF